MDTFFSDNRKSFCAAEKQLPLLLDSTELHNSLRKRAINWVRIPPYSLSQAGSWDSMVKLIKNALTQVMGEARPTPPLMELQTFVSDAMFLGWPLDSKTSCHFAVFLPHYSEFILVLFCVYSLFCVYFVR